MLLFEYEFSHDYDPNEDYKGTLIANNEKEAKERVIGMFTESGVVDITKGYLEVYQLKHFQYGEEIYDVFLRKVEREDESLADL